MKQSLKDRMAARAEVLERQQTEVFEVPGWGDLFAVELRALSYRTMRRVQARNERVHDEADRELYNMADQIVLATEGFVEVNEDGTREPSEGATWVGWVEAAYPDEAPDGGWTPRQAVLKLITDKRIHFFTGQWVEWAQSVRSDVDEEVGRDFDVTG